MSFCPAAWVFILFCFLCGNTTLLYLCLFRGGGTVSYFDSFHFSISVLGI